MFNCFFSTSVKEPYAPSRPREYIHKRDKREEKIPIFKYAKHSNSIKVEDIVATAVHPDAKAKAYESEGVTSDYNPTAIVPGNVPLNRNW